MSGAAAAIQEAPPPAPDSANHWALVIGIKNYNEYEPLDAPRGDANRFCRWLTDVAKVPPEHIILLDTDEPGVPNNTDILKAFIGLGLRFQRWKGERLYIYYAGHGISPNVNEVAVVPADALIDALEVYGAADWVDHIFKRHLFTEIVMFLDCCRDASDVSVRPLPFKPIEPASEGVPANAAQKYCVLVGSNAHGKSFQMRVAGATGGSAEDYRGVMTDVLLEGLNGAYGAVDPQLNAVTTASLERYLQLNVPSRAKGAGVVQKSARLIGSSDPIILLQLEETPKLTFRVTTKGAFAGKEVTLTKPNSDDPIVLMAAGAPAGTSDHQIPTNTRYVLNVGGKMRDILDPTQMPNPYVLELK